MFTVLFSHSALLLKHPNEQSNIMKLSARTRYAARLLLSLARSGDDTPTKTTSLSEATGISVQFIEQIIKPLKKSGLIASVRGAAGGHMLTKAAQEVTVADVVRIMEGGVELTHCCNEESSKDCPRTEDCLTRVVWLRASRALERELDSITLADLLAGSVSLELDAPAETTTIPASEKI